MPTSRASALSRRGSLPDLSRETATPFLKWVGGKGKLRHALGGLLPPGVELMRHVEPFVGGGALFFARAPERALLCDINADLIGTYEAVRDEPQAVLGQLRRLSRTHDEQGYYKERERYNARAHKSRAERAAQFIYLNKTCFNGLYRVNRRGEFNVPMGRYTNPNIADSETLLAASRALAQAELRCTPFESLLSLVRPGDFVYLDPPYEPLSRTANFTSYAQDGFSQEKQSDLRNVFRELDRRGAKLMLSNSDVPFIRDLYRGFEIEQVFAPRAVSCDAKSRGPVSEVVVRNYR
jgi:DNA adenine methylase